MNELAAFVSKGHVQGPDGTWSKPKNRPSAGSLSTPKPECSERVPLVSELSREKESGPRFEIVFHCHAIKPCDWDNYSIKELQDMVVHAGLLPGDDWTALRSGSVFTHKVWSKSEEKTVIVIERLE